MKQTRGEFLTQAISSVEQFLKKLNDSPTMSVRSKLIAYTFDEHNEKHTAIIQAGFSSDDNLDLFMCTKFNEDKDGTLHYYRYIVAVDL